MPVEDVIRLNFWKSFAMPETGSLVISAKASLVFARHSGSGIPELELRGSPLRWVLSYWASERVDSDTWHVGDLGEKKGDWFAEKNADDEDEILDVVTGNNPNLELSSRRSILTKSPDSKGINSHACSLASNLQLRLKDSIFFQNQSDPVYQIQCQAQKNSKFEEPRQKVSLSYNQYNELNHQPFQWKYNN